MSWLGTVRKLDDSFFQPSEVIGNVDTREKINDVCIKTFLNKAEVFVKRI